MLAWCSMGGGGSNLDQMGPKGAQRGSTGGLRGDKRGFRGVPDYTKSSGQFDKGFHEVVPNFL